MTTKVNKHANLSLISVTLTVILAAITHTYELGFGHRALVAGAVLESLLILTNIGCRRKKYRSFLVAYSVLNGFAIIGFGLLNGLWNHTIKISLYYLHNWSLPPLLARLFLPLAPPWLEIIGALTFVNSMFAAHYLFRLIKEIRGGTNNE